MSLRLVISIELSRPVTSEIRLVISGLCLSCHARGQPFLWFGVQRSSGGRRKATMDVISELSARPAQPNSAQPRPEGRPFSGLIQSKRSQVSENEKVNSLDERRQLNSLKWIQNNKRHASRQVIIMIMFAPSEYLGGPQRSLCRRRGAAALLASTKVARHNDKQIKYSRRVWGLVGVGVPAANPTARPLAGLCLIGRRDRRMRPSRTCSPSIDLLARKPLSDTERPRRAVAAPKLTELWAGQVAGSVSSGLPGLWAATKTGELAAT